MDRKIVINEEDLRAIQEFKKKLDSWLLLIMTVGNFLAAGMLLLVLLRILWEYLPI